MLPLIANISIPARPDHNPEIVISRPAPARIQKYGILAMPAGSAPPSLYAVTNTAHDALQGRRQSTRRGPGQEGTRHATERDARPCVARGDRPTGRRARHRGSGVRAVYRHL